MRLRQEILIAHVLRKEVITPSRLGANTCDLDLASTRESA